MLLGGSGFISHSAVGSVLPRRLPHLLIPAAAFLPAREQRKVGSLKDYRRFSQTVGHDPLEGVLKGPFTGIKYHIIYVIIYITVHNNCKITIMK